MANTKPYPFTLRMAFADSKPARKFYGDPTMGASRKRSHLKTKRRNMVKMMLKRLGL